MAVFLWVRENADGESGQDPNKLLDLEIAYNQNGN